LDFSNKNAYTDLAEKLSSCKKAPYIIIGGGDGSMTWGLQVLEKAQNVQYFDYVMGIMPIGTGNDLSRCLGWGPTYPGSIQDHVKNHLKSTKFSLLDRWDVRLESQTGPKWRSNEMVNYFSFGIEADIVYKFDALRRKDPDACNGPLVNKWQYGKLGAKSMFNKNRVLNDDLVVMADGKKVELKAGTKSLVISNLLSMGGGACYWGKGKSDSDLPTWTPPELGDGKLELMSLDGMFHIMQKTIGLSTAHRLSQPREISIELKRKMPVQMDGEAWIQQPGKIIFRHKCQALVAVGPEKTRGLTTPSF